MDNYYNNDIPSVEICGEYYLCEECTARLEAEIGYHIDGLDWDGISAWIMDHQFAVCCREIKVG